MKQFLALKLDKGRVLGGSNHPPLTFLPIFPTMKMTFNLNKFWYGVRLYGCEFVKRNHDNTIKDNVIVRSSNLSQNDGTIRILNHFWPKITVNYQ